MLKMGSAAASLVGVIAVLALGALIGFQFVAKAKANAGLRSQLASRRGTRVETSVAGPRDIETTYEAVGSVESPYQVNLAPQVTGRVTSLTVREGDSVRAGQTLVKIDPSEVENEVLQNEAAVAQAQARYTQAQLTQQATDVGVQASIRMQEASRNAANANYGQTQTNYNAQVASADAAVADAQAKAAAAGVQVASAKASLISAQSNAKNAASKLERAKKLFELGAIAKQDLDDAQSASDAASSALTVAQSQITASQAALTSAEAVVRSAQSQADIVRVKGKSDVEAARAAYQQSTANLDVASANRSQSAAYRANLAALKAAVAAAEAILKQSQARLAYTSVASPIDGTVTARNQDPGSVAGPNQPVLTVQFLKWVYVSSTVPIEDAEFVRPGQIVEFTLDAFPSKVFHAPIAEVNRAADPQSRQFGVRLKLDNPNGAVRPGMFARLKFVLSDVHAAVAVPREAVAQDKSGSYVFVVDSGSTAHKTPVTVGGQDASFIQITSGVKSGDQVVTLSYQTPKDGAKVQVGGGAPSASGGSGGSGGRRKRD